MALDLQQRKTNMGIEEMTHIQKLKQLRFYQSAPLKNEEITDLQNSGDDIGKSTANLSNSSLLSALDSFFFVELIAELFRSRPNIFLPKTSPAQLIQISKSDQFCHRCAWQMRWVAFLIFNTNKRSDTTITLNKEVFRSRYAILPLKTSPPA